MAQFSRERVPERVVELGSADTVRDPRGYGGRRTEPGIGAHVGLAYSTARRFRGRGADADDLSQVALLARVEAVDRFEPGHGSAFATFAISTILGVLKRHLRDRTWA